jgi:acyl carrier protein
MMTERAEILNSVEVAIAPFNKKGIALTEATTFAGDLEWDSLTVMDFVAAVEDEFDVMITMNMRRSRPSASSSTPWQSSRRDRPPQQVRPAHCGARGAARDGRA